MFNSEIEETLNQANWAVENQKFEYAQVVIGKGLTKIKQRNKYINLTDSSEGVWETVEQNQSNPLPSESEDENKLQKLECRAAQKKRRQEPKILARRNSIIMGILTVLILCCPMLYWYLGLKEQQSRSSGSTYSSNT